MSEAMCEQWEWSHTRASEEGGVIVRAITKDPELLMVPAMIDPS